VLCARVGFMGFIYLISCGVVPLFFRFFCSFFLVRKARVYDFLVPVRRRFGWLSGRYGLVTCNPLLRCPFFPSFFCCFGKEFVSFFAVLAVQPNFLAPSSALSSRSTQVSCMCASFVFFVALQGNMFVQVLFVVVVFFWLVFSFGVHVSTMATLIETPRHMGSFSFLRSLLGKKEKYGKGACYVCVLVHARADTRTENSKDLNACPALSHTTTPAVQGTNKGTRCVLHLIPDRVLLALWYRYPLTRKTLCPHMGT